MFKRFILLLGITLIFWSCEQESIAKDNTIVEEEVDVKKGRLQAVSEDYVCEGDFTLQKTETGISLILESNFKADDNLPGYGMFLTNNLEDISNALQVDGVRKEDVSHFSGVATFNIEGIGVEDYAYLVHWCIPFDVKIGVARIQ